MDIDLLHIRKAYQDSGHNRSIFDDMTAHFPTGRIYAVLGKSGVGKSSLLNLISGIDVPDQGTIQIDSHVVSDMNDTDRTLFRRRNIGFIYQFFNLIPVLTVLENVTLICKLDGKPEKAYQDRALSLLDTVGLYDRKNDYPDRLSGGEQQRVAIVRALVNDPEILLADEPTGNLDTETGQKILEMISNLARKGGKTLIIVTHSREAISFADKVFRVRDQKLIAQPMEQVAGGNG